MFKEIGKTHVADKEKEILDYWEDINILNATIENRSKDNNFVFYDGPAYANGYPGLHHMMAKFLKDAFTKYKTMKGYRVLRKIGWDTHGLPVELKVEEDLGLKTKKDIEEYGIEKFNHKCKESVLDNEKEFVRLTKLMGQFIDTDNPYLTYKDDFIETEWWILKKFFDEGLFYEGNKILPYCPRCGTGLATHEVAQGYKEITTETVIAPFKKKDEDVYFLVWTTTPWTLLSNVALCVNPSEDYVLVKSQDYKFIVADKLKNSIFNEGEYEVLEAYKGRDLEYTEYEQLLPFLEVDKKAFYVTADDYVTMDDGTGIVHIAPAFGEDDNRVAVKYKLPTLNPVGENGQFTEGPYKDMLVFDADKKIIEYLRENNKLFKKQSMEHNYPHCWRCDSPLIYYSMPSYYLEITKIKDDIVAANKTVNWYPSYVGERRFANWLENLNDWALSRNRYWGTPLPLWKCECGHTHMVGSKEELIDLAIETIDESIELHRPYVDDIHIKCEKCDGVMTRTEEVIDVWFDAGAMPFAQYHYPFENKELFESQFPADFISEGIDQTRGWFYTLMVISVFLTGKSPFKNVLVNDLLLDKEGKKMSKSRGNVIEPFSTIEKYGSDAIRWYLPYASSVWTPIKFDEAGLKEVHSKFFSTLNNTYNFFVMYANIDGITKEDLEKDYKLEQIDSWLISRYNNLVKDVESYYEEYDLTKVVRSITNFLSEDVSNWYIRRNRERFWSSEKSDNKLSVYKTTYDVLIGLSKLIAPVASYKAEEIYMNLTDGKSVHLTDFPKYDEKLIDEKLEEQMSLLRKLISLGRNVREETKIKVRQPISEVILASDSKDVLGNLQDLLLEELNVKEITFEEDLTKYLEYSLKPNFKEVGKLLGKDLPVFQKEISKLNTEDIIKLSNNKPLTIEINDTDVEVTLDLVEVVTKPKDGFNSASDGKDFVILNTNLTDELIEEGLVRELISKIQLLRKNNDFEILDKIKIYFEDSDLNETIENNKEIIMNETLAESITFKDLDVEETNINDFLVKFELEVIKQQ